MELGHPADKGRSYKGIEREALNFLRGVVPESNRKKSSLPSLELFEGLERYAVRVGGDLIQLSYGVADDLSYGVEAATRYDSDADQIVIVLSEDTYGSLELDNDSRARFTVAHEIGHAVLHAVELVRLSKIPHTKAALMRGLFATHQIYRDTEWQANAFAGALLMPAAELKRLEYEYGDLSAGTIQQYFQVSYSAAEKRLSVYNDKLKGAL